MSFVPQYSDYISQIRLPGSATVYHIKDSEARNWIEQIASAGIKFTIAWDGKSTPVVANIPLGVTVTYQGTEYTGTKIADETTAPFIFLVFKKIGTNTRTIYEEYVTITEDHGEGADPQYTYFWEELGDTDISLDSLGQLAWKNSVTLTPNTTDVVLGASTTFKNSASTVTFTGDTSDSFVRSYPGSKNKLVTTSIKGVGTDVTFTAVNTAQDRTATYTVFGTNTEATKITTASKTATKLELKDPTTASRVTPGTAFNVGKPNASATPVSRIGNQSTTSVLETASVTGETLILGSVAVSQSSVVGCEDAGNVTPYTVEPVTVPVIKSNDSVTFNAVATADPVVVPVVTSNEERTATQITTASKTAATSAANPTTVATGKVSSTDPNGDEVMVGLGTADTANAVTSIGTGTAAAQTITVGTNDKVTALTDQTAVIVS